MLGVIELVLWMLAGWDGMATARAAQLAARLTDPGAIGLAELLAGNTTNARHALELAHPWVFAHRLVKIGVLAD